MSIGSDLLRGNTDTIILAHLLKGDSYGYQINRAVELRTEGQLELKEATLYSAFRRLEQGGCIISYWGDENTGARRRYYSITEYGKEIYNQLVREWNMSKKIIDELIKGE